MRIRPMLTAVALTAISLSFVPAGAGQYSSDAELLQGASVEATLGGGGKAKFSIRKLQGLETRGPKAVIPTDEGGVGLPIIYAGVPTATGQEQPPRYYGCIEVTIGTKKDGNCGKVTVASSPSSASFDPLLETGSVTFSVKSSTAGYFLTATAMLTATTQPTPVPTVTPSVSSIQGTPRRAELLSNVSFSRNASVIGSVRSPIIGGGVIKSVSKAVMVGGLGTIQVADRTAPFCMSPTERKSQPGEMPWNEFPPKPWIPEPPRVENFDPNNPRYDAQNPPTLVLPSQPYQLTRICPKDV